jgi:hypothetical protein
MRMMEQQQQQQQGVLVMIWRGWMMQQSLLTL